jgi:sortase A
MGEKGRHRSALIIAIAIVLLANCGVVVASTLATRAPDVVGLGADVGAAAKPDLTSVSDLAAFMATMDVPLPRPHDAPENPHAATPEVQLGRLELPSIGVDQTLWEGVTLTSIDRGPSHWPGSAMPGELGNVVVAGHRITHSHPFFNLDLLKPGDPLIFTTNAGRFTYRLTSTEVVPAAEIRIVNQTYALTATLFACHPKGSARFRIVGHFELVSSERAERTSG